MFNDFFRFAPLSFYITTPITSINYNSADIICEDADGDGYFFWGIGDRPESCPSWVPIEPDGDDSDPTKGPMDMYGNLEDLTLRLNDTIYINANTIWNTQRFVYNPVVIRNNSILTLTDAIHVYAEAEWFVENGSKILIDGGVLSNPLIYFAPHSEITVINNGRIENLRENGLKIPLNTKMKISYGKIQ